MIINSCSFLIYCVVIKIAHHNQDFEDITQEVLAKIIQNINFFAKELNFTGWLSRVTMNAGIDHYHQKKRTKTILSNF